MTREEARIKKEKKRQKKLRQKKINRLIGLLLVFEIILGGFLIYGYKLLKNDSNDIAVPQIPKNYSVAEGDVAAIFLESTSMISNTSFPISKPETNATLTVMGDIMMHKWQIERSYDPSTDSFDVSDAFTYMEKYLSHADMTIGNLETTLPGRNNGASTDVLGYSGYPMFSSPEVLADALKAVGVDFLQTANNHSLDSWEDGIYATLDYLDQLGLMHTGTFRTKEDADTPCVVDINGITFGFVAYTYATNGLPVPEDSPYCINTLELYENEKLEEMYSKVRELDNMGVDFVCPLIHFGTEYTEVPDSWQEMVVDGLFEAGADVIFGGHPHVAEPMDVRTITNPDGTTRTGYVIYSFGNFVSSQRYDGVNKDLGYITDFTFSKEYVDGKAITKVSEIRAIPTYVYWTDSTIGVVPVLEAYNNKDQFSFLSGTDWNRIDFAKDHVIEVIMAKGNLDYTIDNDEYVITPKQVNE